MDKFENMIKQSVEGYEAPFNPQAWENVSNDLPDSFDHGMKEAASSYEAPFNPAAWEAVSSQLGPSYSIWKWIAGAAAVFAVVTGSVYLFNTTTSENNEQISSENTELTVNDDVQDENSTVVESSDQDEVESTTNNVDAVEGNDQGPIHHIDNNLVVEIDPIDVDDNGSNDNNGQSSDEGNSGDIIDDGSSNTNTTSELEDEREVNYTANPGFKMSKSEICQGQSCTFTPDVVINELIYVWNFGDGSHSNAKVGEHRFNRAGEFTVSLEVRHPKTNKLIASSSESLVVNNLPSTDFTWEKSNEVIPTISFINLTDEATNWTWDIKGLKKSNKNEFDYTFRKAGNYIVELTAENEKGCQKSTQKTIKIEEDYNLLAPTAFSPNGDFKNDEFIPEALKIMNVEFTMNIMDKSGNLVYTTQNANEPWDGLYTKDNTPAPAGAAYIWRVVLVNNDGEQEMYQGQVIIIR